MIKFLISLKFKSIFLFYENFINDDLCNYFDGKYCFCTKNDIKLTATRNSDKSVDINFEKSGPETITIYLNFTQLSNSNKPNSNYTASGYSGTLVTLKPINKDENITYSYSYRSIRGKLNPKLSKNIVYSLPYASGVKTKALESNNINSKYFGNEGPKNWKSYYFATDEQQNVTAARKGLVVEVVDSYDDKENESLNFTSKTNKIIVEQPDGSLAEYDGFMKGSIVPKVGTTVFPGDILGKNVKKDNGKYAVAFHIRYLSEGDLSKNEGKNLINAQSFYTYITPIFKTADGDIEVKHAENYEVILDDALIQGEMSKREIKNHTSKK